MMRAKKRRSNEQFITFKQKLSESFQIFCEGTSMHGFIEIYRTKNYALKRFWICIIIVAFSLLGIQLYGSINQYIDQSTITSIQLATENDIIYPPLKYCIFHWFYWFAESANIRSMSKTTLLSAMSRLTNIYSEIQFNISEADANLTKYFKERQNYKNNGHNYTFEDFFIENTRPLNTIPMFMFHRKELLVEHNNIYLCFTMNESRIQSFLTEGKLNFKIIEYGKHQYSALVSSLSEEEIYGAVTATDAMPVKLNEIKSNQEDYYLLNFLTKYRFPDMLLVDGFNNLNFKIAQQVTSYSIQLRLTVQKWLPGKNENKCKIGIKSLFSRESCSNKCRWFGGIYSIDLYHHNMSHCPPCKRLNALIQLNEKPSNPGYVCKNIITFKGKEYDDVDECTMGETYINNYDHQIVQDCTTKCYAGCEKWKWEMFVSTTEFTILNKRSTEVTIKYPMTDNVLVLQELDRKTWQDFVGVIGGILGVWTGASILSMFQLLYLCCPHNRMSTDEVILVNHKLKRKKCVRRKRSKPN